MGARSQNPFSATLVLTEAADSSVIMNEARANCQVREKEREREGGEGDFSAYLHTTALSLFRGKLRHRPTDRHSCGRSLR